MKKTYKIEVDCANCAAKMEQAAAGVSGVANATVSFMTQKMNVELRRALTPTPRCRMCWPPAKRWRTTARSSGSEQIRADGPVFATETGLFCAQNP